jgi:hypothetical protein
MNWLHSLNGVFGVSMVFPVAGSFLLVPLVSHLASMVIFKKISQQ